MMNDILQQQRFKALTPDLSSWVSASAGSGKTKILTDRVIALLLEGVLPRKILCLTFTKAAASEMVQRIRDRLAAFKTLSDDDLKRELQAITPRFSYQTLTRARRLFDDILNVSGGLNIQTLHAFAESLLHKFPLEVGIHPHFRVIDEHQMIALLNQGFEHFSRDLETSDDLHDAFVHMMAFVGYGDFKEALMAMVTNRGRMPFRDDEDALKNHIKRLWVQAEMPAGTTQEKLFQHFFYDYAQNVIDAFDAKDGDVSLSQITAFLKAENRYGAYENYRSIFLTQKKEPRKKVFKKAVLEAYPFLESFAASEMQRILAYEQKVAMLKQVQFSNSLLTLGFHFLNCYTALKKQHAVLDFDDLIFRSCALLQDEGLAPWVLYKLDAGLEHILVDEAQDTNAHQWQVINALASEFFLNDEEEAAAKTLFVVGDRKQSIYSFQQANPKLFDASRLYFQKLSEAREKPMHVLHLNRSYRSFKAVLDVVDHVFKSDVRAEGVEANLNHEGVKTSMGSVLLLPLYVDDENREEHKPWALPLPSKPFKQGRQKMIEGVTQHIESLLSKGVKPSEIMILVRKRGKLMGEMVSSLKNKHLPVAGVDRLVLTDALVVKDLLALMTFALNPDDDLNCATVLKSPFIGLDEDLLFKCAFNRENSLFEAFRTHGNNEDIAFLDAMILASKHMRIYEFLCEALYHYEGKKKLLARLGYDAAEWLDAFLDLALQFENDELPSLEHFLAFVQRRPIELKRDLSSDQDAIRVMTVHGSKGLEARYVYLIDTTSLPRSHQQMLIFDEHGLPHKTSLKCDLGNHTSFDTALKAHHVTLEEEYNRLLYVALTRAREHLVIAGYASKNEVKEKAWYASLEKSVSALGEKHEDGTVIYGDVFMSESTATKHQLTTTDLPSWLLTKTRYTPKIAPKNSSDHGGSYVQQRGTVIHKMLELWAFEEDIPAFEVIQNMWKNVPKTDLNHWYEAVKQFLKSPVMLDLQSKTVLKEVPVQGCIEGNPVKGIIDVLVIEESRVVILDYKTEQNPPSKVPEIYIKQLQAYKKLIEQVYKQHTVEAAVIWTETGELCYV